MSIMVAHGMKKTGTAGYSVEVQAVINRFIAGGQSLTAAEILKVVAFVDGLVADGIWSLLDEFWWSKGIETELKSRIGFKGFTLIPVGVPSWSTGNGWGGFTTAKYYNTTFRPDLDAVNYQLDDAMLFAWGNANIAGYLMGAVQGTSKSAVIPNANNQLNGSANQIAFTGIVDHLMSTVRLASNSLKTYRSGVLANSSAGVSISLAPRDFFIGCLNANGTPQTQYGSGANIKCAGIGAGVGVNQATLYSRINTLINT